MSLADSTRRSRRSNTSDATAQYVAPTTNTNTRTRTHTHTHTHTHKFNGPLSRTTRVCRYQKGKTSLDLTEARDSEWQWHQLGHMQVCISLQTDNHASTPTLSFLQAGCPSCRPTNSVKALKAVLQTLQTVNNNNRTPRQRSTKSSFLRFRRI